MDSASRFVYPGLAEVNEAADRMAGVLKACISSLVAQRPAFRLALTVDKLPTAGADLCKKSVHLRCELSTRREGIERLKSRNAPGKVFLEMIAAAGFENPAIVAETGFKSSGITTGVLIRAEKPR